MKKILFLSPLVLVVFIPFVLAQEDPISSDGSYLIRDEYGDDNMIAFVVTVDRDDAEFRDGYFLIDGNELEAHSEDMRAVNNSNERITMLGTVGNFEQFFIGYEKDSNKMTYEFNINGETYRGESTARVEYLGR